MPGHGRWLTASLSLLAAAMLTLTMLSALPAPPASADTHCRFVLGFASLKALIDTAEGPDKVGECLENQHSNPVNGDALQQTTGGLMVWRKLDNWTAFTDGYRTWINGPNGLQSRLNTEQFDWEGGDQATPVPVPDATPDATPAPQATAVVVAPVVVVPTPTPVPDFGDWQFIEETDAFTNEVRKSMYVSAHTMQGSRNDEPARLTVRCTVGAGSRGVDLIVWWQDYIGSSRGELTDVDDVHPIEWRVDDGTAHKWEWIPSTHRYSSFAPHSTERAVLLPQILGSEDLNYVPSTKFSARVTKPDDTTITGVWSTVGAKAAYNKLRASCGLTPQTD